MNEVVQYEKYVTTYYEMIYYGVGLKLATYRAFVDKHKNYENDMIKAFPLLPIVIESLQIDTVMTLSKLIESNRGDRTFQKFINFIESNMKHISKKYPMLTTEIITENKTDLGSIEKNLNRILTQRDKYFAHADKKYFFEKDKLAKDFPETYEDMVTIINSLQNIICSHYKIMNGGCCPIDISDFAYTNVDRVLDFIKEGAINWHKEHRKGEEW